MFKRVTVLLLLRVLPSLAWTFFALALASWWFYFSLTHLDPLSPMSSKHRHMLIWEGSFFLAVLFVGGAFMTFMSYRERWRAEQFRELVGAYSHELKTSITRLRLDAENLQARTSEQPELTQRTERIIDHTKELERQLHNALYYSQENSYFFISKRLALPSLKDYFSARFPELTLQGFETGFLVGNLNALSLILSNLLHNATHHGQAKQVTVTIEKFSEAKIKLSFCDDGIGISHELKNLGARPGQIESKGTGLGLYLVKRLSKWMNAQIKWSHHTPKGFCVSFIFEGEVV